MHEDLITMLRKKYDKSPAVMYAADVIEALEKDVRLYKSNADFWKSLILRNMRNLSEKEKMIIIRTNLKKLPNSCCFCPLRVYDPQIIWNDAQGVTQEGGWVCPISRQLIDNTKRPESCPLDEVTADPD